MRTYRLGPRLGAGAFGEVYAAEALGVGGFRKPVALKLLHPHLTDSDENLQRLRDEARLLGLLRHPALLGVDDLVQLDGRWALVLELVEGPSLADLVTQHGALPGAVVLHIGRELAGALAAAHEATVDGEPVHLVHRDVKPANVHLTPAGRVKLLDFGIAAGTFATREAKTAVGDVLGTPHYMPAERLIGDDGPESDLWALGATLATLLTGRVPAPVELGSDPNTRRVDALLDGLGDAWRARLEPLLAFLPSERPTARETEAQLAADLLRHPVDLRTWASEHVPPAVGEPSPLTGRELRPSAAELPVDPNPPAPSTRPRPGAPRRRGSRGLGLLLAAILLGGALVVGLAMMMGLVGVGVLNSLITDLDVPDLPVAGGCPALDPAFARVAAAAGPGKPVLVEALQQVQTQCALGMLSPAELVQTQQYVDLVAADGFIGLDEVGLAPGTAPTGM